MTAQIQVYSNIHPQAECLIVPVPQTDTLTLSLERISQRFGVALAGLQRDFKADYKEVCSFYLPITSGALQKVYLLGMGKQKNLTEMMKNMRSFFFHHQAKFPAHMGIDLMASDFGTPAVTEALLTGALLGGYELGLYQKRTSPKIGFFANTAVLDVYVVQESVEAAAKIVHKSQATAETLRRVMDLGNAPSNYKNPQTLAQWAMDSGKQYDYQVTVFGKEQLSEMGMHALLAVNKGSALPPALIVMEYKGNSTSASIPKIGLVGKGVTFDTGGISLKDSTNMHLMKSDMGGAAAVLGTLELAARLKLPVHLIGVIPSTENCVDGESIKPGDVIGSYAGKTIEVIDTDAEGRLILADALSYITKHHQPDVLIDLATLTGSVIGTLGYVAAGMFSNNDILAADLLTVSEQTGEKLWRLPLWDDYKEDLKSDVADVKNYHGKPFAGAIMGAKFLEVFTDNHPAWAHLDIAAMAFMESEFGSHKNATGYGVQLLIAYVMKKCGIEN